MDGAVVKERMDALEAAGVVIPKAEIKVTELPEAAKVREFAKELKAFKKVLDSKQWFLEAKEAQLGFGESLQYQE